MKNKLLLNFGVIALLFASLGLVACNDDDDSDNHSDKKYKKPHSYTIYYNNITSNHSDVSDAECRSDIKLNYVVKPKQSVINLSHKTSIEDLTWDFDNKDHGIMSFSGKGKVKTIVNGKDVESKIHYRGYGFAGGTYGSGIFTSKYCKGFYTVRVRY